MCLVDHDQARRGGELRQHLVAEARVVQALGADQQHVGLAVRDLRVDWSHSWVLAELIVRAWIPARPAASTWLRISASSGDTITVGPAPRARSSAVATKYTADFPSGALHHQRPAPGGDQGADRRPLVVAQRCALAGQRTQVPFSLFAQALVVLLRYRSVYVGHAPIATRRVRHMRRPVGAADQFGTAGQPTRPTWS